MKKILLKIHLYSGLLFLPYLVIFGLSSLHINHHFPFLEEHQDWTDEPEIYLRIENISVDQLLAESIRDSLELMGWCPWWEQNREGDKYRFLVVHFGADYEINANVSTGLVKLKRRGKGFGSVVNSLHFLGEEIPNGTLAINSWRHYQNFTVVYLLVAIVTGIFLFTQRKRDRLFGLLICLIFFTASILLMVYVWQVG